MNALQITGTKDSICSGAGTHVRPLFPGDTLGTSPFILRLYIYKVNHLLRSRTFASQRINPLLPSAYKSARIDKISILKLEGIIKKISYERRDYESVDEKGLS